MDITLLPTKGNLMLAKSTLQLSRQGYDLLDKKRNILVREMMGLIDKAKEIQSQVDITFSKAYKVLQMVNISMGISTVQQIGYSSSVEDSIQIRFRSIMGVEIPIVTIKQEEIQPQHGFYRTSSALDEVYKNFDQVKKLTVALAEVENAIYRLANHIKKTQKRANSLKNIIIPKYEEVTNKIQNALEEKEREEFTRLKMIKKAT